MTNPRKLALFVLTRWERDKGYSNIVLDAALKQSELSDADRSLATRLFFGVISRKITLDYYISRLSSLPDNKIEPEVRNILRLGLYQLMYLDRVPPHAAVNESVALAPKRAVGFVNAVLRNYQRRGNEVALPCGLTEKLSVRESVPVDLCERLISEYGDERAESIMSSFNKTPPLTLRVNTLRTDRAKLLSLFSENGVEAYPSAISPYTVTVNTPTTALLGYDKGLFFAQDTASQLCCAAVGATPGSFLIDCCAAPGSKSFGSALYMENRGRILSCDLHKNKLSLVESGARSLGIGVIETRQADARIYIPELEGKADAVLCDVPCSGFGVIEKKPEIRYKSLQDAACLPEIQYAILENCSRYVKPGGLLVYSTCTVLSAENSDVTHRFSGAHSEFTPEGFTHGGKDYPPEVQLLPDSDGCDGFYIAGFRRN